MSQVLTSLSAFISLVFLTTAPTQANSIKSLPSVITNQWQLELVGQTKLRRLGLHIYDASFWMQNNQASTSFKSNLSALSITYARNIRASRLLSSTSKEWNRLGFANKYPLQAWLGSLEKIWPDVKKGDQLIVVTIPKGKTIFFDQFKQLGTVNDPDFGPAFLAIWLDKNSRYKKNRNELLGG